MVWQPLTPGQIGVSVSVTLRLHLARRGSKSWTRVTARRPRMRDPLPVMASDLVSVAPAGRCGFSQLSLTYRAGGTGIEREARGSAAEDGGRGGNV